MSRSAVRMNRIERSMRTARARAAVVTHHVPYDTVGMYAKDSPRAVCGAHCGQSEIAMRGAVPTCQECARYLREYERMTF